MVATHDSLPHILATATNRDGNMQTENRFFDDLARMASGAFGTMTSMKAEFENQVRQQIDSLVSRMKLVTREEFDAMQAMLIKTREEQESLAKRLAVLEGKDETQAPE
jgi:BMFP domain-containing protein YqiC